jgi:hypothetical protein
MKSQHTEPVRTADYLGNAATLTHIRPMQNPDLLALRRAAAEERLIRQAAERSARRRNFQSYPITLSYRYLTPQQQQERVENAQDVLRYIGEWTASGMLSERQIAILRTIAGKLRSSRGTHPMSPWEWEQFWAIRDYLMPDP